MIEGLICPNLTFFDSQGNLDEKTLRWHLNWILDRGVNGLFVTGTYGSGYLMRLDERIRVYEIAKEVCDKHEGSFVIGHVGTNDTNSSLILTKAAKDIGLDAVSAVNPYTFKYTDSELIRYYEKLVNAADGMPVFAYNNPKLTNKVIDLNLVIEFAKIGILAIKDSTSDIDYAKSIIENPFLIDLGFKYITGSTTNWPELSKIGVDSMISGSCNYIPELVKVLFEAGLNESDSITNYYDLVNEVNNRVKSGNSTISSHIALKARGYNAAFTKEPLFIDYENSKVRIETLINYFKGINLFEN